MTEVASNIYTDPVERMTCEQCQAELTIDGIESFANIVCPKCQTSQTVPAKLGGLRLHKLLGQGGMGAVYQGVDVALDRPVAIKVLLRSVGDDAAFLDTFQKEAKAAAALNHPNIVQIYQFGSEKGQPYIAMELLQGGRLDKMIASGEPLDPRLIVKIAIDVAEGLRAAGNIGLVHGDIKPENILMDANGTAKVVDFGLAAFMNREGSREGIWGTPYYIAPEKVRGKPGDQRSDIYSLGATIFHALTLRPPFEGKTAVDVIKARLHQPAPPVSEFRENVHPEVERVVQRALEAEPTRRYPTYVSLIADLRKVAGIIGPPRSLTRLKRTSGKITIPKPNKSISGGTHSIGNGGASGPLDGASRVSPKRRSTKSLLVLLLVLLGAGAGFAGWWYWQDYQAKRQALLRRAAIERISHDAREEFVALDETVYSVHSQLTAAYPMLHAATKRLAAAATNLVEAGITDELEVMAPEMVTVPERILTALDEAELAVNRMRDRLTVIARRRDEMENTGSVSSARQHLDAIRQAKVEALEDSETAVARIETIPRIEAELDELDELVADYQSRLALEEQKRREEELDRRELEAQREAEAAERQRLAEQEQADREMIAAVQTEILPLLRQNDFSTALARAREVREKTTDGAAREAADLWLERLELLPEMLATIIEQLNLAPYPWGWLGRLDIVGADAESVHLTNRRIPWQEVPAGQMLRFLERYTNAETLDRNSRARLSMAAAAYCYENNALPLAREYAAKAVGYQRRLRPQIERIMPELESQ